MIRSQRNDLPKGLSSLVEATGSSVDQSEELTGPDYCLILLYDLEKKNLGLTILPFLIEMDRFVKLPLNIRRGRGGLGRDKDEEKEEENQG